MILRCNDKQRLISTNNKLNCIGVSINFSDVYHYSYFLDGLWHGRQFVWNKYTKYNNYRVKDRSNGLSIFKGKPKQYFLNRK